jgi:tRNA (guanine-N7-)-methyltransferase
LRAVEKRDEIELKNLYFINYNGEGINEIFDEDEIEKIYLNFSDPWPKDRHAKRRLTSKEFLRRYDKCLRKDGHVIVKTDNRNLFDFTLEQAKEAGWITDELTYDLHKSNYIKGNIMTEYEEKFVDEGKPIHRTRIYRK